MKEEVGKAVREELRLRRKLVVLSYARVCGNAAEACREFNVPSSSFYEWKKAYDLNGRAGLVRGKPIPKSHPKSAPPEVIEKILHIRSIYQLGPERIMWYLERYHGINISESSVYRILVRHGVNRLPKSALRRAIHTKRYSKTVPGHHIQVDVKFLWLKDAEGQRIRRFQYTAIDDATRIRALKIYQRHTQKNATDFINYVIEKFPFRLRPPLSIATGNCLPDNYHKSLPYNSI